MTAVVLALVVRLLPDREWRRAIPVLLMTGPGGQHKSAGYWFTGIVMVLCTAGVLRLTRRAEARGGGEIAALGTAFATCLAIFAVSVGTYAALPRLAPDIAPANATDPLLENRIESTDPYVAELLLGALLGVALIGAARAPRTELPG